MSEERILLRKVVRLGSILEFVPVAKKECKPLFFEACPAKMVTSQAVALLSLSGISLQALLPAEWQMLRAT